MDLLEGSIENLEYELYTNYSGRCMYGKECFGFSTRKAGAEMSLVNDMLQYVHETGGSMDELIELIGIMANGASTDSMGLGTIYYYRNLQWDREKSDNDEDYDDDGE